MEIAERLVSLRNECSFGKFSTRSPSLHCTHSKERRHKWANDLERNMSLCSGSMP